MQPRKPWSDLEDPEAEFGLTLGQPVPDDEINQLCELARAGAPHSAPARDYAVNRVARNRGYEPVLLPGEPGTLHINPDLQPFAAVVLDRERRRRAAARERAYLSAALDELPQEALAALAALCAGPHPRETAAAGITVDDPRALAATVNAAAQRHGIPAQLEAGPSFVRAAQQPADTLIHSVNAHQAAYRARNQRARVYEFLRSLDPAETRLLKHAAGTELLDPYEARRLDPLGHTINEHAHSLGIGETLQRRDHDRWRLQPEIASDIRDALTQQPPRT